MLDRKRIPRLTGHRVGASRSPVEPYETKSHMTSSKHQRLELTWFNKDKALIPTENGKYGYSWVDPRDPRYCETHTLVEGAYIEGIQAAKEAGLSYSERADLEPTTDNLLINGESGDVLEALTRVPELADKYLGKIKLCYIDPPFNTAGTFTHYEDNLEHSVWLTMMRDRLVHIKKLLSDDGSIWVHLDDSENHRMRLLLDEVFGASNFIAEVVWQKADSPRNDAAGFSISHDSILIYSKNHSWRPNRVARLATTNTSRYKSRDGDPVLWRDMGATAPGASTHQGMVYAIQHPVTGSLMYPTPGRCWSLSQDRMLANMREYADYDLRELDDAAERARICGVSEGDIRLGVPAIRLIPIKGVVGPWPSDVGSLLAMCLVRMRDPSALARRCSSRPLIAFDDPFDVPRRAVTRPLRRLVGQAHRVAVLRRAPSAIPAGPVVAGAGFGNVRRGLRGRVRGASQSNSWAPSVA